MTIKQYKNHFIETLTPIYDAMEAESFFHLILEDWRTLKRVDLALNPDLAISESELLKWNAILEQLQQEIPIQYLLGKAHFYGLDFEVNENVLIPRPETEELVEWILSENGKIGKSENPKIVDIGTGSGCIAIALAKNLPNATVSAIDVSEPALATAERNAIANDVSVQFLLKDILETEKLDSKFDIMVSNPPYIRNLEKAEIRNNVLEHEPHLALFVDDRDALIFYRKIADLAIENLAENGKLFFEINQYLGSEMFEMLKNKGFKNIEIRKDIYGNDRMMAASLQ